MIISPDIDYNRKFIYTIGSDNQKIELIPPKKIIFSSDDPRRFDISNLPKFITPREAENSNNLNNSSNRRRRRNIIPSRFRPRQGQRLSTINRPNGIRTGNPEATRRQRERERNANRNRNPNNTRNNGLTQESITNPPRVRMIDRRLPTIATGTRGPELFPAGTRTNNGWNQEPIGRARIRPSPAQTQRMIDRALALNRRRIRNRTNSNGRLRLAPTSQNQNNNNNNNNRCRACEKERFPFI